MICKQAPFLLYLLSVGTERVETHRTRSYIFTLLFLVTSRHLCAWAALYPLCVSVVCTSPSISAQLPATPSNFPCVRVTFVYVPSQLILRWGPHHNIQNRGRFQRFLGVTTKYGNAELLWLTQPRTKNSFAHRARRSRVHCTVKERHNKCTARHFVTEIMPTVKQKLQHRGKSEARRKPLEA